MKGDKMKVTIEVECDNAAFRGRDGFGPELKRILILAVEKAIQQKRRRPCLCDAPEAADKLLDISGNTVGFVRLETKRTERKKDLTKK